MVDTTKKNAWNKALRNSGADLAINPNKHWNHCCQQGKSRKPLRTRLENAEVLVRRGRQETDHDLISEISIKNRGLTLIVTIESDIH